MKLAMILGSALALSGCMVSMHGHHRHHVHAAPAPVVRHRCWDGCEHRPRMIVYPHGHHRHCCDRSCSHYVVVRPRPHRVVVYPHGHHHHHCDRSCGSFRFGVVIR